MIANARFRCSLIAIAISLASCARRDAPVNPPLASPVPSPGPEVAYTLDHVPAAFRTCCDDLKSSGCDRLRFVALGIVCPGDPRVVDPSGGTIYVSKSTPAK